LDIERMSWSSNNSAGAYASPLKWTMAGNRYNSDGSLYNVGTNGHYWSSTVSGASSRFLFFGSSFASMYNGLRAFGSAVRCVKN
jgi:hypothetical protein